MNGKQSNQDGSINDAEFWAKSRELHKAVFDSFVLRQKEYVDLQQYTHALENAAWETVRRLMKISYGNAARRFDMKRERKAA